MSLARAFSRALLGINAPLVTVETHISAGLPSLAIVGMPETAVRESKERVRSAIINSNLDFPTRRLTVNLAPADLPKSGGRYDLAIALFHPLFESRHLPLDEGAAFRQSFVDHLLAGYATTYTLDPVWLTHLPLLMTYRCTLFYAVLPKNADEPADSWTARTLRDLRPIILDGVSPAADVTFAG